MSGTIPLAMSQQSDANGLPLAGALLYIFAVGTVATPQNAYQDFALTKAMPWPIPADEAGRIPMFWLADGQVHVRLTDASGMVIMDVPVLQVLGPSGGGGGGGGGGIDPTAIFGTGDMKYRPTTETLQGWVKMNALTIGSATSGATQRANADVQNLFVYLWNNFTNDKCPVIGGRGATALADFQANKQISTPDWRGKGPMGLDDMGNVAAGIIQSSNVTSKTGGVNDGPTTPAAFGGEANHTLTLAEAPRGQFTMNDPEHSHTYGYVKQVGTGSGGGPGASEFTTGITSSSSTGITLTDNAGGGSHNNMSPFVLGTWFQKL